MLMALLAVDTSETQKKVQNGLNDAAKHMDVFDESGNSMRKEDHPDEN